jgi:hypothetical protein
MRSCAHRARLLVLLVVISASGCAPTYLAEERNGDRSVTTYARAFGLKATTLNNEEAVLEACGNDRPIIFDEKIGSDSNGIYRRWDFGCAAP